MDRSKILILVTGTLNEPWDKNWKECYTTWVPLLKELGYSIKIAIGKEDIEDYYLDLGEIIYFKTSDSKTGLVDKSIKLPIRWILEQTDYEYYFRIDSDTFVHPLRFDEMLMRNITIYNPDYMGCVTPYPGFNVYIPFTTFVEQDGTNKFASGVAYMLSRKVMSDVYNKLRVENDLELGWDDYVLGRSMRELNISILHENSISMESPYNVIIHHPEGTDNLPFIENKDSHLSVQHYMNGKMHNTILKLL
jgi:hypothetical protein